VDKPRSSKRRDGFLEQVSWLTCLPGVLAGRGGGVLGRWFCSDLVLLADCREAQGWGLGEALSKCSDVEKPDYCPWYYTHRGGKKQLMRATTTDFLTSCPTFFTNYPTARRLAITAVVKCNVVHPKVQISITSGRGAGAAPMQMADFWGHSF
jgi:hypothetical protein